MSTASDFLVMASAAQQRTILGGDNRPAKPQRGGATRADLSISDTCAMDGCNNTAEHECHRCRPPTTQALLQPVQHSHQQWRAHVLHVLRSRDRS